MDRTQVIKEIDELLKEYCEDCFLKKHFRQAYSKTFAHQFCIKQCTVGESLRQKGQLLMK